MERLTKHIFTRVSEGKMDPDTALELLSTMRLERQSSQNVSYDNREFAIVGMSAKMPLATDVDEFWERIKSGDDCITPFPESRRNDIEPLIAYTYMKGKDIEYCEGGFLDQIDQFDYKFFNISPKEASLMDPAQRVFLQTSWNCLEDAGYGGDKLAGTRTGLFVGYSGWPMYGQFVSHVDPSSFEISVLGNISAIMSKRLPQLLNLKGPSMLVDTSCSSSLTALHLAMQSIREGESEQAIVGGIRLLLMPIRGMISYGIESNISRASVFDEDADGTILSEGVAAIMIKPLQSALRDSDNIYAVIKGSAINQDGTSTGITTPNVLSQEDVILRAWERACIDPKSISYMEAMGTATKIGDPIEIEAIQKAFRRHTDKKQFCAIGSLKTTIGHTDSAAGIAAVIKMAMALSEKKLPPTLHFRKPNRNIHFESSPVYINDRLREWEKGETPRRCGVSAFGFSGTNCHVVLEEAPERGLESIPSNKGPCILTISAKSKETLCILLQRYLSLVRDNPLINLADLCYTANTGRGNYSNRLALLIYSKEDLLHKLVYLCEKDINILQAAEKPDIFFGEVNTSITNSGKEIRFEEQVINETSDDSADDEEHLRELCLAYVQGVKVTWENLYTKQMRKVRLPVYPFDSHRCWLKVRESDKTVKEISNTDMKKVFEEINFNF